MPIEHEWHLVTQYCIHCGVSNESQNNENVPCHRFDNVIAISHLVSQKRLKETDPIWHMIPP